MNQSGKCQVPAGTVRVLERGRVARMQSQSWVDTGMGPITARGQVWPKEVAFRRGKDLLEIRNGIRLWELLVQAPRGTSLGNSSQWAAS